DEIDSVVSWLLPASRSKNGHEVVRPLSKMALTLLATRPRLPDCPYVFSSNGIGVPLSFTDPKKKLDARANVHGWVIHDLRRLGRSLLSRAGVDVDIAERCLGHSLPTIRSIYDKHQYTAEMRHAFELLAAEIERIVNPPPSKVVPIGRR